MMRSCVRLLLVVSIAVSTLSASAEDKPDSQGKPGVPKDLYRGKVVLLREALERRGIESRPEMDGQVVLEMPDGKLIPLVADWRGRAFYQDKKLRDRKVELIAQQQKGLPYIQILAIYTFDKKDQRQYTDYWCDICSIPMYEIKPCDCCQGDIRLRFQHQELPDYIKHKAGPDKPSRDKPAGNKPTATSPSTDNP